MPRIVQDATFGSSGLNRYSRWMDFPDVHETVGKSANSASASCRPSGVSSSMSMTA